MIISSIQWPWGGTIPIHSILYEKEQHSNCSENSLLTFVSVHISQRTDYTCSFEGWKTAIFFLFINAPAKFFMSVVNILQKKSRREGGEEGLNLWTGHTKHTSSNRTKHPLYLSWWSLLKFWVVTKAGKKKNLAMGTLDLVTAKREYPSVWRDFLSLPVVSRIVSERKSP